jgi:wyosine [tRNA(Phe)-imidazoG37] synthetase (radical SAM superfamily)
LPQIATCGLVCVYCKEKERIEEARKKEAEAAEQRRKELYRNRLEATLNSIIEQVKGGVYDKAKLLKDLIHAVDLSIEDEDENKESY